MNFVTIALTLFICTSVVHVDARSFFIFEDDGKSTKDTPIFHQESAMVDAFISSSSKLSPEFICESCLEVSRKAEGFLTDPKLPEKVNVFANDACHFLHSDLREKCVEMLKSYANQAILFLQTYLSEEKLCNSSGLCPADSLSVSNSRWNEQLTLTTSINHVVSESGESALTKPHMHFSELESSTNEISGGSNCAACHAVMEDLSNNLENPETKIKIMRALLNACKHAGNQVNQCKEMVFEYGPMILSKLEAYLMNNDLCYLVHICGAPTSFTTETMADF